MPQRSHAIAMDLDAPATHDDVDAASGSADDGDGEESTGRLRVCLECGRGAGARGDCAHAEVASFALSTAPVRAAVAQLREAANARQKARRALESILERERSRGRAELECGSGARPEPLPARPAARNEAVAAPCPRCTERDAQTVTPGPVALAVPPRAARRRVGRGVSAASQASFGFAVSVDAPVDPAPSVRATDASAPGMPAAPGAPDPRQLALPATPQDDDATAPIEFDPPTAPAAPLVVAEAAAPDNAIAPVGEPTATSPGRGRAGGRRPSAREKRAD